MCLVAYVFSERNVFSYIFYLVKEFVRWYMEELYWLTVVYRTLFRGFNQNYFK